MSEERYQNKIYVGSGGMATVYRAWDSVVGRDVALKEIAAELRDDTEVRDMFLNEARKMAKVHHPNVVQVYDVLLDSEIPTIIQEFMDGGSLANQVGAASMGADQVLQMLQEVCRGLRAIHNAGLIHRDMKPDNILLAKGEWKVADFGVAMSGEEDVLPFIGSKYAAPEVLNAPQDISVRSDIYSLGVMAMELLLGSELFETTAREALLTRSGAASSANQSAAAFWQRWVSSDVQLPLLCEVNPTISREISEFLALLTSRDIEQRPASCDDVLQQLDELRSAETMRMGAPTAPDPRVKSTRARSSDADVPAKKKKPLWFKLTITLLLLLLAAVSALLLMPSKPKTYEISIVSEPAGAKITINGENVETASPSTVTLGIGDHIGLSLPHFTPVEMTLSKGMDGLAKDDEGNWTITTQLERSFFLESSDATQQYLNSLWAEVSSLNATIPTGTHVDGHYNLSLGTPLYIAIEPPANGALSLIHLSSDNFATLVYPNPSDATLGVLAGETVTIGDELDIVAHEPLGNEWIVLALTRDPLVAPNIEGAGPVADWARYYEFGGPDSPAEQLFLWLTDAARDQLLAFDVVPIKIVRNEEDAP